MRTQGYNEGCVYYAGLFFAIFIGVLMGLFWLEYFGVVTIG